MVKKYEVDPATYEKWGDVPKENLPLINAEHIYRISVEVKSIGRYIAFMGIVLFLALLGGCFLLAMGGPVF